MAGTQQLVMGRPASRSIASEHSAIRWILFVIHDDDQLNTRFQAALSLARACSAHLQLVHVVPVQAYTVVDTYGGIFASGEIVEALEQKADNLRKRLEAHLASEDLSWNYEVTTSAVVPELLKHAALADIVFIGRSPPFHEFSRTGPGQLGEFLCSTRTPLCVPGDNSKTFDPFGTALIAWNGSLASANAVRSTIGLLKIAATVRVIRYEEENDRLLSDKHLLDYLEQHGLDAELETVPSLTDLTTDLVADATRFRATYLVMGGYSHSRAGEFLFGGVTRELLRACPISLVMAH